MDIPMVARLIRYFSPATSPYYVTSVGATVALILTCDLRISDDHWHYLALPIYLALVAGLLLAFGKGWSEQDESEHEQKDQIRISTSLGSAGALLALVFGGLGLDQEGLHFYFWLNYVICLGQTGLLFLASAAGVRKTKRSKSFNFVQLSLIGTVCLIGATYSLIQFGDWVPDELAEPEPWIDRFRWVGMGLYALWAGSIYCWLYRLRFPFALQISFRD